MKNESSLECATAQHCRIQQQLSKDQLSPFFAFFLYYLTLAWFLECLQLFKMWNFRLTPLCGRFPIKNLVKLLKRQFTCENWGLTVMICNNHFLYFSL